MVDIRLARAALRMTQRQLGAAAGVSQRAVSYAESGRASPRIRAALLSALARLGIGPTDPFARPSEGES